MPSDVIKRRHELAILMNGMQGLSLGEEFEYKSDSESKIEGVWGQSTIEGVQTQSTIEGVGEDSNIELHGAIENTIYTIDTIENTIQPGVTLTEHEPQELATEEPEDPLMLHEPQVTAVASQEMEIVYEEAVHESQTQNTDDIIPANIETQENHMDERY